jgi:uroporphyrinogen-III synthase
VNDLRLAGRRILVTRAASQAGKLSDVLRALGAEPVEVPVLEIRPPASYEPLDNALRRLDSFDWLILTSANTVRVLAERAAYLQIPVALPLSLNVAAVGDSTASAARGAGIQVTFVPESYVAESLVEGLLTEEPTASGHKSRETQRNESGHDFGRAEKAEDEAGALAAGTSFSGKRILIARAAIARDVIPDALRAAGAQVDIVDAYENVLPESAPALLREELARGIDAATFTSSSSVTHLKEAAEKAHITFPFAGVPAVSIGPVTSRTLRESGWPPATEAAPHDIPGLVAAVTRVLSENEP